jgi:hypothetical protein
MSPRSYYTWYVFSLNILYNIVFNKKVDFLFRLATISTTTTNR